MASGLHGFGTVSPYLIVAGAGGTIDFLARAFGAVELRRFPAEGGRVAHAEVRIGDSLLMLADATPEWPAVAAHVHVYVPDVDATYRRALEAGAIAVQELTQQGRGPAGRRPRPRRDDLVDRHDGRPAGLTATAGSRRGPLRSS